MNYCSCPPMHECAVHGLKGVAAVSAKVRDRKVLKQKSEKQEARDNGWLRAIVYAQLLEQRRQADRGVWTGKPYYCEGCGAHISGNLLEALGTLQPCHKTPRKAGTGVRFYATGKVKDLGLDTFDNIYPGCEACNLQDHYRDRSDPRWSA